MSEAGKSLFLTQSIIKGYQSYCPTNIRRLPSQTLKVVAASRRDDSYLSKKRKEEAYHEKRRRRDEAIQKERREESIRKERRDGLIRKERRDDSNPKQRRRDDHTLKKERRPRTRPLVAVSPVAGRGGAWDVDQTLSLKALQLEDLLEDDEQEDAEVLISLTVQEHAGFGLSIYGRVITSFTRICSNCSSPYCREIDKTFNATVLSSNRVNRGSQLPEIGGDDPSVIYVKPGREAALDPLIQESIRLTVHDYDTCSELCEKSDQSRTYAIVESTNSIDMRWSKLLELKQRMSQL